VELLREISPHVVPMLPLRPSGPSEPFGGLRRLPIDKVSYCCSRGILRCPYALVIRAGARREGVSVIQERREETK
jgi:hypothetical protein